MPVPSRALTQLLGTTTFRLASSIVALFVVAAAVIVWLLHAQTNAALTEQVLAGLRSEADALSVLARDSGVAALDRAVAERSIPRSTQLYGLTDAAGVPLAGNLPGIPAEVRGAATGGVFRYRAGRTLPTRHFGWRLRFRSMPAPSDDWSSAATSRINVALQNGSGEYFSTASADWRWQGLRAGC